MKGASFSFVVLCIGLLESAAATPHDDLVHLTPIEQIAAHQLVLAQDENSGEVAKKRVLELFKTHPDHLHHVSIDTDGDGQADETLSGTAEHPFWDQDASEWVRMGDLKPGTRLHLLKREGHTASQTPAYVLANQRQNAPPGETFTTYNFEVEDFHTYFVGDGGVWVHNTGRSPCEEVYASFTAVGRKLGLTGEALRAKRFEILEETKRLMKTGIPSRVWGRSAADVSQKMLDDYKDGLISLSDLPTVKDWRLRFFGRNTPGADVDVHHSVEEYIQGLIGINPDAVRNGVRIGDSCPGIPLPRNKRLLDAMNEGKEDIHKLKSVHKGMDDGGISGILQSRIKKGNPDGLSQQQILDELRQIYNDFPDTANQWPAARGWLRRMQELGELPNNLNIPQ
jgi:hypothetical protein